jgi:hypothetical protein
MINMSKLSVEPDQAHKARRATAQNAGAKRIEYAE